MIYLVIHANQMWAFANQQNAKKFADHIGGSITSLQIQDGESIV